MKSFPKSEYWHFKKSWKHYKENFQFSRRNFFGLQDFDILTRSYLTSCRDSRRGFGHPDFEISLSLVEILGEFLAAEILRSLLDLGENLDEILRSRRESRRVFGRQDFKISPRSRRESRRVFGRRDFKISPRSWRVFGRRDFKILPRSHRDLTDLGNLASQKLAEILAGISVKILQGYCTT